MIRALLNGYTKEQHEKLIDAIDAALDSLECPLYKACNDMDLEPPGGSYACCECQYKRVCSDISSLRDFLEASYYEKYRELSPQVQALKALAGVH